MFNYLGNDLDLVPEAVTAQTYTVTEAQRGKTLIVNTAVDSRIRIPVGLARNYWFRAVQIGTGTLEIQALSGVTANALGSRLATNPNEIVTVFNTGANTYAVQSDGAFYDYQVPRSVLSADVDYTDTTTLAATPLSCSVFAGKYRIDLTLYTASVNRALKFDFGGGTATATASYARFTAHTTLFADGSTVTMGQAGAQDLTTTIDLGSGADAQITTVRVSGEVEFSAAGTFVVRAAQRASDPDNTTIERGSHIILTKLN